MAGLYFLYLPHLFKYEMESANYGRKGSCFLQFLLVLILVIICFIWVYYKNNRAVF